jgi:polar amino acid transport system permease protein
MIDGYRLDLGSVWRYRELLVTGFWVTLQLWGLSLLLGTAAGLVLGLLRLSRWRVATGAARAVIEVFRGTPPLVQLFWFYYCLPLLFDVRLSAFVTGVLSLSLFSAAYFGEIVRGGIQSVHKGQVLAARALGYSHLGAMRDVVLPQAVRRMLPPLLSQSIDVLKTTALASSITVPELMYQTYYATAQTFRFVEFYTVAALVYFAVTYPLIVRLRRLEWRGGV